MSAPTPAGMSTKSEVSSSIRYKKMTLCEKALQRIVFLDSPSIDFFPRQKLMSLLKARQSKSKWTADTLNVMIKRTKLVSAKIPFT